MTYQDIIFAAILALVLTWLIRGIAKFLSFAATRTTIIPYKQVDFELIITKCHMLFPIESLYFKGDTFSRGMGVRVETERTSIEATFVGVNKNNMVGFITPDCVISHELDIIEEIIKL
ncbi:MAG: hypothetical protein FWG68_12135 [Defluviitaleaceae bacterium]|nr:hypothetical protein [Defluviitaleaceae bacterium]